MEPADGDSPPFWPQTTIPTNRSRRHQPPSPLLNPALLIILIPITALLLLFFLLPPFLSLTSQIFKPNNSTNAVKKSWDSLNILLVLFAILCGIFARKTDDDGESTSTDPDNRASSSSIGKEKSEQSVSQQWYDQFSDNHHQKIYNNTSSGTGVNRLRRSSSSYPDLRQDSLWGTTGGGDDRFRFFDDFELNRFRPQPKSEKSGHSRRRSMEEVSEIKVIPVDKFELRSSPAPPSPSLSPPPPPKSPVPPPPPPPPVQRQKPRQTTYQSVSRKKKVEVKKTRSPPLASTPQPPPPPPPPPMMARSEEEYVRIERKKSNATKEIKMVLASIYNQRKRKKKQKTKTIYDDSLHSPPSSLNSGSRHPPPSPPPPPPPPPPSVFYNLFKKGSKSKRVHSVPPTPPPPPSSSTQSSKRQSKIQPPSTPSPPPMPPTPEAYQRRNSTSAGRPPLPTRINSFYDRYEKVNSGGQSPLIPMPPPPPPPFRMSEMEFSVRGDYVKIRSSHSSRCSSPELHDVDLLSKKKTSEAMDGGDVAGPSVFCPSPDVNIKADTFIARLRDEWKLEKINSLKGKQKLGHDLGP